MVLQLPAFVIISCPSMVLFRLEALQGKDIVLFVYTVHHVCLWCHISKYFLEMRDRTVWFLQD